MDPLLILGGLFLLTQVNKSETPAVQPPVQAPAAPRGSTQNQTQTVREWVDLLVSVGSTIVGAVNDANKPVNK
jgi:hypothetical protein